MIHYLAMSTLALVTVTYNAERNLSFFLPSLDRNRGSIDALFFVDNASSDNTVAELTKWKDETKEIPIDIIRCAKNSGYASGINRGIRKALEKGYDYILVTNNDLIFDEGFVAQLAHDCKESHTDVAGIPASVNQTDIGVGYTLDTNTLLPKAIPHINRHDVPTLITQNPLPLVGFVHGGTILFTKHFFETIGLYDDELFFGGDEIDFLYRVHDYNSRQKQHITCTVSLRSFLKLDNLTKHNSAHKMLKAKRILQGTAHIYLKHRFSPVDTGLYREIGKTISSLAKKSILRHSILFVFSVRALALEIASYYMNKKPSS